MTDEAGGKDEDTALTDDDYALLGVAGDEAADDPPAPETGLHALGQLGTAILVVSALVVMLLAIAVALGWIFH